MLDRRQLLSTAAAASALPLVGAATRSMAQTASPGAAQMNLLFDSFVQQDLRRFPEGATQLGLDKGSLAWTKGALSEVSIPASEDAIAINRARLKSLHAVDRAALNGMDAVNYDVVDFK